MNDIAKHNELPAFFTFGLTESEKTYLIKARSTKVVNINGNELVSILNEIIKRVYFETGITINGFTIEEQQNHLKLLAINFYDAITNDSKYKSMGIDEVRQACQNGTKGYYGEWYGRVALVTFLGWLDSYKEHAEIGRAHV